MTNSKDKKKELTFKKVEKGMIMFSEDMIMVGLPVEVETRTQGGGGLSLKGANAAGEKYEKIRYDWKIISGSPLPPQKLQKLEDAIATTSGTVVASLANASITSGSEKCKYCGTTLLVSGKGFFCHVCGKPTE